MNWIVTRFDAWLATCFGLGRFPIAPGTLTSAIATIFAIPLVHLGWQAVAAGIIAVTALGIPVCGRYARTNMIYDPPDCVLDEVAGQWLALIPVAVTYRGGDWLAYVAGFIAFRVFDVWKPWPVWWAERLPGGTGIMADDVVAAVYAGALVFGMISAGWV